MDALPGIWSLTPIGALIGAIVFAYWGLLTGRIITKTSHERELTVANKRGDEWKETALDQRTVNAEIRAQNMLLIEATRTSADFFAKVTTDVDDTGKHHVRR